MSAAKAKTASPLASAGFTLIELVIAIVVTGIVAGMAARLLSSSINMYDYLLERREMVQESRMALQRIVRELRQIASPDSITYASADSIAFYKQDGSQVTLAWTPNEIRLNTYQLAHSISMFSLVYYDDQDLKLPTPVANPLKIWRIRIIVGVGKPPSQFTLYHEVEPRNF